MLGKARDTEVVVDGRAIGPVQPAHPGEQRAGSVRRSTGLAERRPTFGAWVAMPAGRHEDADDVIAAGEVVHAGADLLDDAGRLMAERHRHGPRSVAVDDREIGVAQARRFDPHQHLARPRRVELDLLNRQRLRDGVRCRRAHGVQDGSSNAHRSSLSWGLGSVA